VRWLLGFFFCLVLLIIFFLIIFFLFCVVFAGHVSSLSLVAFGVAW
jgi:hypothetical protein